MILSKSFCLWHITGTGDQGERIVGETVALDLMLMTNDYMTGEVVHVDRGGCFV